MMDFGWTVAAVLFLLGIAPSIEAFRLARQRLNLPESRTTWYWAVALYWPLIAVLWALGAGRTASSFPRREAVNREPLVNALTAFSMKDDESRAAAIKGLDRNATIAALRTALAKYGQEP